VAIYLALATTVVLVLRSMSRRFRQQAELVDTDVPYGPREPAPETSQEPERVGG
jgi:cytochrome d ubiquinol oxidase subunit I